MVCSGGLGRLGVWSHRVCRTDCYLPHSVPSVIVSAKQMKCLQVLGLVHP